MKLMYQAQPAQASGRAFGGSQGRGCETAWAHLYPRDPEVARPEKNSHTSKEPPCLAEAQRTYGAHIIISGHVINENFGGDGTLSYNQTCLTATANGLCKSFDGVVVRAWTALTNALEAMRKLSDSKRPESRDFITKLPKSWFIQIVGEVSATTWTGDRPNNCITTHIDYTISVHGTPDLNLARAALGVPEDELAAVIPRLADLAAFDGYTHRIPNDQI